MKSLLIVAGEYSSHVYAEKIIELIGYKINIFYVSPFLSEQVQTKILLNGLSEIGFGNLPNRIAKALNFKKQILELVRTERIENALLIDFPGFNLPLAKSLKKNNSKVFYFIAPKFWIWNYKRVEQLKNFTDCVFSIFPFENEILKKENVKSLYCGNVSKILVEDFKTKPKDIDLLILAGSREAEVKNFFNKFDITKILKSVKFQISALEHLKEFYPNTENLNFGNSLELLARSKKAIVTSGTATLETALLGIPQVVVYDPNWLTFQIGKNILKIPFVALPNILLKKKVVPELLSEDFSTENVLKSLEEINLSNSILVKDELADLLGNQNPFKIVANELLVSLT
ncbi:MAG: hypothetical protein DWQ06_12550 [Calditrichaeota bacterium]|nr:MAG: hypothetical protein DWQ06_12550 [Calditrichota bacterium]